MPALKKVFAAVIQSLEKVSRSLEEEVERASSGGRQVGSEGSVRSFREEGFVAIVDRETALGTKRGFAKQTLL